MVPVSEPVFVVVSCEFRWGLWKVVESAQVDGHTETRYRWLKRPREVGTVSK